MVGRTQGKRGRRFYSHPGKILESFAQTVVFMKKEKCMWLRFKNLIECRWYENET